MRPFRWGLTCRNQDTSLRHPKPHTTTSRPQTKCPLRGRGGERRSRRPSPAPAGNDGSQPSERLAAALSCLFWGENHPLFLSRPLSKPLKPRPLPSPPAPFPVCCSCAPPGFPPGPVRLFLRRLSLPLRFPPAVFCLGLLPGPGGPGEGQWPPLQPGRTGGRQRGSHTGRGAPSSAGAAAGE